MSCITHIPRKPGLKHTFTKMLLLIGLNQGKSKKQILEIAKNPVVDPFTYFIIRFDGQRSYACHDTWSALANEGYIRYENDGNDVVYFLTPKGKEALRQVNDLNRINQIFA